MVSASICTGCSSTSPTLIAAQNHEQHYGIEHMAVETDDYAGTLARLQKNGVRILEELPPNNGRHVCLRRVPRRRADGDHREDVVV